MKRPLAAAVAALALLAFPVMSSSGAALIAVGAAAGVVSGALLVQGGLRTTAPGEGAVRVREHRRRGDLAVVVGILGGLLTAMGVITQFASGRGQIIAVLPTLIGMYVLVVLTVSEMTWPRHQRTILTEPVRVHAFGDVSTGWRSRLAVVWVILTLLAALAFRISSSGPREVSRRLPSGESVSVSPYPGWWYSLPVVSGSLLLWIWARLLYQRIVTRPGLTDLDGDTDWSLRRQSARRVYVWTQMILAVSLAGLLTSAGIAMKRLGGTEFGSGSQIMSVPPSHSQTVLGDVLLGAAATVLVVAFALGPVTRGLELLRGTRVGVRRGQSTETVAAVDR